MLNANSDGYWMQRVRSLTQALVISGTLNICLLATFAYFALRDKEVTEVGTVKEASPLTNQELFRSFSALSFQELLALLEDSTLVEEGYTKRDLALASLVAFHHFNLERALGGYVLQERQIAFRSSDGQEKVVLAVFPGLADFQFRAILHYARTERFPLTSQGLFLAIKRSALPRDPELLEAFYHTPEFHVVVTLFGRSGMSLDREKTIEMLIQGDWKTIADFTGAQRLVPEISPNKLRVFLSDYLNYRSELAATLLLESDREFVAKRLDDQQMMVFLDLFGAKTVQVEALCKELLISLRSDEVRKKAAEKLYTFAGLTLPDPYDYNAALARFMPGAAPRAVVEIAPIPVQSKKRVHTIQDGDSLWKIGHKYKVSVEAIKRLNKLETDKLRVGKQLEIPE